MAERSGFLIFVFVWYVIGASLSGLSWLVSMLLSGLTLIGLPTYGLILLSSNLVTLIALALTVVFLIKVWKVSADLKRWTDIVHSAHIINTIASLTVNAYAQTILSSTGVQTSVPGVSAFQIGFAVFAILVHIGFWIGIRVHLTRLERSGRASFSAPLLGRA